MIIKESCLFIFVSICFFKTVDNYQSFSFLSCSQVKRLLKWRVYSWTAMKISTNEKHLDCCSIHYCPRNLVLLEGVSKTKKKWTFVKKFGCYSFQYSGCGGNQNNFHNKQECLNICEEDISPASESTFISTGWSKMTVFYNIIMGNT